MEEGGFGLDLSFLEKRRPRIAMAGKRKGWGGVGRGGGGKKDLLGIGRGGGYGRRGGEKDGGQKEAGWGAAGTGSSRWMWSKTDQCRGTRQVRSKKEAVSNSCVT